jgi:hypothetical protein
MEVRLLVYMALRNWFITMQYYFNCFDWFIIPTSHFFVLSLLPFFGLPLLPQLQMMSEVMVFYNSLKEQQSRSLGIEVHLQSSMLTGNSNYFTGRILEHRFW